MDFLDNENVLMTVLGTMSFGKSHLIKTCIHRMATKKEHAINSVLVFSETAFTTQAMGYLPQEYIHSELNEEIVSKYVKLHLKNRDLRGCIVFDDIMGQSLSTPFIKSLIANFRHYHINLIFAFQDLKGTFVPFLRNVTWIHCQFKEGNIEIAKELYKHYGSLMDKQKFIQVLAKLPKYAYLRIDVRASEKKDKYEVLMAPEIADFKLVY